MNTRALVASFFTLLAVPLLVFSTLERAAFAQQASDVSDVVVLKDGSRFRGAITELVPRDHVVILLPSGESRRYEMGQVDYAGAVAKEPAAHDGPEESPTGGGISVTSKRADVHVASDQHDVQLLVRTGQGQTGGWGTAWNGRAWGTFSYYGDSRDYGLVCTAPCEARMPTGTPLHLALAAGGGGVVEPREPLSLEGASNLDLHLVSRRNTRVGGWVLFTASLVVGSLLVGSAGNGDGTWDAGRGGGGLLIMLAGPLASLALILQHDQAFIRSTPASGAGEAAR